jgi:hypothetical protein
MISSTQLIAINSNILKKFFQVSPQKCLCHYEECVLMHFLIHTDILLLITTNKGTFNCQWQ